MGDHGLEAALRVTAEAGGRSLFGLPICPVVRAVRWPEGRVREASEHRVLRYEGGVWQEHRLVPSRVRLGDQSDVTLSFDAEEALDTLGVRGVEALDAFIDRLLQTGLAAITLGARSARRSPDGVTAYVYTHVWLDKDALIAPDGALCFADLEGLERRPVRDAADLFDLAERQLDEHLYELMFAVDQLLTLSERWRDRPRTVAQRRADLALRWALALDGDPWAQLEERSGCTWLSLRDPVWPEHRIALPLISA